MQLLAANSVLEVAVPVQGYRVCYFDSYLAFTGHEICTNIQALNSVLLIFGQPSGVRP